MRGRNISKIQQKFSSFQKDKKSKQVVPDVKVFKTHTIIQSQAQIMFPNHFQLKKYYQMIAMIKFNNQIIWAEITEHSFQKNDRQGHKESQKIQQFSILYNLIALKGIKNEKNNLQGEIKFVLKAQIPKNYYLQYVEFFVKDVYLSRRDQYKILKHLQQKQIHVYSRKVLYFDKLKLQVGSLLHNRNEIAKSGMINKHTTIIFRTACSKYTILIEISKQMFELNHENQLFLQKTIQFLTLFFLRNQFFQTKHRLQIILYARLFYPQFDTLQAAYKAMRAHQCSSYSQEMEKKEFIQKNFAVSFQKDYQGRIYQDVYRSILWQNQQIQKFRQNFWEKVSAFLFTINWTKSDSYVKIFSELMEQSILEASQYLPEQFLPKKRPFQHYLECQLSTSQESCFFQAISIVSEQYKHHYYFRSLNESGNSITIVSAGKSHYIVDETTYKMAKSNIYLTNISCYLINLKWRRPIVTSQIICVKFKPIYKKQKKNIQKLMHLIDWCKQEDAYKSPMNMKIKFPQYFQIKSHIYPQNLQELTKDLAIREVPHICDKDIHFKNNQQNIPNIEYSIKQKKVEFIELIFMSDDAYTVHQHFYDYEKFKLFNTYYSIFKSKKKNQTIQPKIKSQMIEQFKIKGKQEFKQTVNIPENDEQRIEEFQKDLKRIINNKNTYQFGSICSNSYVSKNVTDYIEKVKYIQKNQAEINKAEEQYDIQRQFQEQLRNKSFRKASQSIYNRHYVNKINLIQQEQNQQGQSQNHKQHNYSQNNKQDTEDQIYRQVSDRKSHILYQTKYSKPIFDTISIPTEQQIKQIKQKNGASTRQISINDLEQGLVGQSNKMNQNIFNIPAKNYRRKAIQIIKQQKNEVNTTYYQNINKVVNKSKIPNIFQETFRNAVYCAKKQKQSINFKLPKQPSHNKQRMKSNKPGQNIHYMNLNFNNASYQQLQKFIKIRHNNWSLSSFQVQNSKDVRFFQSIQIEQYWKNLIFPVLTPIYTQYQTDAQALFNLQHTKSDDYALQKQICKYLMNNFQIQKQSLTDIIYLSKGHVRVQLRITNNVNVATFQIVDDLKQKKIIPCMFYRYLSYEDMDARFGSKYITFSDTNYYSGSIIQNKKSVKLAIVAYCEDDYYDSKTNNINGVCQTKKEKNENQKKTIQKMNLQNIKTFIKNLKQKYQQITFDEQNLKFGHFQVTPSQYRVDIDLVKGMKNQIYHQQFITIAFDKSFHPLNVYTFTIQWQFCCATYINQFILNIVSIARKNKLLTHLVSRDDAFNTKWSISTLSQLVFDSRSATSMLESDLVKKREWIWDNQGYYMSRNGQAFLRFVENKNLVEWRQNIMKQSSQQRSKYNQFIDRFFLIASAYDVIGGLIDLVSPEEPRNKRLYSLSLST